jgi:hypothetical protein
MLRVITMLCATECILRQASDPIPSHLLSDSLWRDISNAKNAIGKISLYSLKRIQLVEESQAEFEEKWKAMESGSVESRQVFLTENTEKLGNMDREWNGELEKIMGLVGLTDFDNGGYVGRLVQIVLGHT